MTQSPPRTTAPRDASTRRKIVGLLTVLVAINSAVWIWALLEFQHAPLLLGTALLAYGLGLRHAVDADHIAAIDNVTRRLMNDGGRPVTVGLFFSLGHSTVVILTSAVVAATAVTFAQLTAIGTIGSLIGTLVSVSFLLLIAATNLVILRNTYKTLRHVQAGGSCDEEQLNSPLCGRGLLARLLRPLFSAIRKSWHMYPLGFLFGLGFDTATEIGLLGISAAAAGHGMSMASIMIFPALFTAGMSLVDTADGILMLGAYGWAFARPERKLYYNLTITFASVVVALLVGGVEALGLIGRHLDNPGHLWRSIGSFNQSLGTFGFLIVAMFIASWLVAALIYRAKARDDGQ